MRSLEDTLAPAGRPPRGLRDAMALAPVALLTLMLLPAWSTPDVYVTDVAAQIASPHLLTALAMLLALRVGVIDLSVWVVTAAGSLLAAAMMTAGIHPAVGFAAAALAGAAAGAINALCVCKLRLPGPVATLLVALAVMGVCWLACPAARVDIPDTAFDGWLLNTAAATEAEGDGAAVTNVALPLILSRTILVAAVYAIAMFGLLPWRGGVGGSRWGRPGALIAAGLLAGLAGGIRTMDLDAALLSARPIGDLRVAAAALLAGGLLLAGPGRTLITAAILPVALLATTMWRQQVWTLGVWGIEWQVVLLIGLTGLAHTACQATALWRGPGRLMAVAAWALAPGSMALITSSTMVRAGDVTRALHRWGFGAAIVAALLLIAGWRVRARRPLPPPVP